MVAQWRDPGTGQRALPHEPSRTAERAEDAEGDNTRELETTHGGTSDASSDP